MMLREVGAGNLRYELIEKSVRLSDLTAAAMGWLTVAQILISLISLNLRFRRLQNGIYTILRCSKDSRPKFEAKR